MWFQTCQWPSWVNDDEDDVKFVMWAFLVVVEVLGDGDGIATHPYLRTNFFTKFSRKSVGRTLTGFHVPAWQEPPVITQRPHKQDAVSAPDHGPRDHLDRGRSHRDRPYARQDQHRGRLGRPATGNRSVVPTAIATALSNPRTHRPRPQSDHHPPRIAARAAASFHREAATSHRQPRERQCPLSPRDGRMAVSS